MYVGEQGNCCCDQHRPESEGRCWLAERSGPLHVLLNVCVISPDAVGCEDLDQIRCRRSWTSGRRADRNRPIQQPASIVCLLTTKSRVRRGVQVFWDLDGGLTSLDHRCSGDDLRMCVPSSPYRLGADECKAMQIDTIGTWLLIGKRFLDNESLEPFVE